MYDKFDLIIIGGSFSGLLMANSLASCNLRIALIERKISILSENSNKRTTAISYGNVNFLKNIGFKNEFFNQSGKIYNIRIKEESSSFSINYNNLYQPMCYVFDNNFLLHKLLDNLKENSNIKIFLNQKIEKIDIDSHCVKIICNDDIRITAPILIAADGKFSSIRKYFKIQYYNKNYKQHALVFNIKHKKPHENNALELFTTQGPLALLPTFDHNQSSVIWTLDEEYAESYIKLEKHIIAELLSEKINHWLGSIEINSEIINYPLSLSYIKEYYYKRILFIGDALHSIHPIAGQGLNLTIQDIKILSEIISHHNNLGCDLGSELVLRKFVKARKFKNWQMIQITDKLNAMYKSQNPILKTLKNFGSLAIDNCNFAKKSLIKYAMQID